MSTVSSDQAIEVIDSFVNGAPMVARDEARFDSIDPSRGETWARVGDAAPDDVDVAVRSANEAFSSHAWRSLPASKRGRLLTKLGEAIHDNAERIAVLETRDNGKLYAEMVAQLRVVPDWLYYYAGAADKLQGATIPLDRQSVLNYTLREPYGVVAVITPWNSPTFLAMMSAAPALAAGNTVVVKPSEVTSASMVEVARLAIEVGFPPGVLNVITGQRQAGEALVAHPLVARIAFTGGTASGRAVAVAAAERLVPVTLELGGKSANIVFDDADLAAAEAGILAGIFAAAGQTCVAGSRALLHRPIFDELLERLVRRADTIVIGDPMDGATQMGPIATAAQLEKVESFVADARRAGADAAAGAGRQAVSGLDGGYFYRPTILTNVDLSSRTAQEEIFGPVLSVFAFDSVDDAIEMANATPYGLAAGVWSRDIGRAHAAARMLRAGTVWMNTYRAMAPQSPFGGMKSSGVGRINGLEGIEEYVQTKSVWCELSDEIQDPFVLKV